MSSLNSLMADNRFLTLGAAVAAFLVFAVLILLLVRLVFGNRLRMSGGRGRQQRLGVVDAYDMDRQRQLILVRRDNTEHLIMIGGPNDLLIESSILRVEPRDARDRPPAQGRELPPETSRIPVPETWSAPPAAVEAELAPAIPLPPMAVPTAPPPPTLAPVPFEAPEPAAAPPEPTPEPPRSRDFIARMRIRGAPPPAIVEPPVAVETSLPPVAPEPSPLPEPAPIPPPPAAEPIVSVAPSAPPLADADFFETEIAKALAPSMRARPSVAPSAGPSESDAPVPVTTSSPPPLPPRAPFRPFPPRRDLSGAGALPVPEGDSAVPRRPISPPRPPPPPFFSRMTPRPKDRVEPPIGESLQPVPPLLSPASPPAHAPEQPPVVTEASPAPEPLPVRTPEPTPAMESKPEPEAVDPFEEEMARLLGRTPGKDA